MKVLILANQQRYEKYMPDCKMAKEAEKIYLPLGVSDEEILAAAKDADVILADAIAKVDRTIIEGMKNLKMIHSEGVAYNSFDIVAARERNIPVCNNKGINAGAVAEQTILLMLALLRDFTPGNQAVKAGHQIQKKECMMVEGIQELGDCKIGLVGFGDIARETAKRLMPFGCQLYYYTRKRKSEELEQEYHVQYLNLDEMTSSCDIISLHVPVTPETAGMVNREFLKKMKSSAYLINTARGEIIDNDALREALMKGWIQGAGFDTIAPEPTAVDNPLVDLPTTCLARVEYSPHIGGVTTGTFLRAHRTMWENVERIDKGEKPTNIVNL